MEGQAIDRKWKKGSAELLLLSLLEGVPRHGMVASPHCQLPFRPARP
jgi:hypothetical protein